MRHNAGLRPGVRGRAWFVFITMQLHLNMTINDRQQQIRHGETLRSLWWSGETIAPIVPISLFRCCEPLLKPRQMAQEQPAARHAEPGAGALGASRCRPPRARRVCPWKEAGLRHPSRSGGRPTPMPAPLGAQMGATRESGAQCCGGEPRGACCWPRTAAAPPRAAGLPCRRHPTTLLRPLCAGRSTACARRPRPPRPRESL